MSRKKQLWDRQKDETAIAYSHFLFYRNIGPTRSIDAAYHAYLATARRTGEGRPGESCQSGESFSDDCRTAGGTPRHPAARDAYLAIDTAVPKSTKRRRAGLAARSQADVRRVAFAPRRRSIMARDEKTRSCPAHAHRSVSGPPGLCERHAVGHTRGHGQWRRFLPFPPGGVGGGCVPLGPFGAANHVNTPQTTATARKRPPCEVPAAGPDRRGLWSDVSLADLRLLRHAIHADWPVPVERQPVILEEVFSRFNSRGIRFILSLGWIMIEADGANLRAMRDRLREEQSQSRHPGTARTM